MPEDKKKKPELIPAVINPPKLTESERAARNADIEIMDEMRRIRDTPHPELDDMTYIQYYESNKKKDLSYLPPKRNKQDVRISSGLTREKDTTLVGTALNMNFTPNITAFDKDDLIEAELGDSMSDLVKKSREIENYQKKRPNYYRELVSQGDVFIQELHIDDFREVELDRTDWDPTMDKVSDFQIKTRLRKLFSACANRQIDGRMVYLGSMKIEYIEDQDTVAIVTVMSRRQAFRRYATWERWENVPTTKDQMGNDADGNVYKTHIMVDTKVDEVAEVILYKVGENRLQIYLNSTPMLPHNYPLTAISPSGELPFAQGKLEPIPGFAYSKSQPSKIKIEQEVLDEATKLMIDGMRQGRKPPSGSRKGKVFSDDIFHAGKITPDLKEGDVFSLLQNPGLNAADFSFYKLIKEGIDEKSVNKTYEGNSGQTDTLGQARMDKQQQLLKLGLALDGFVNFERRLTWLRIYNILEHWTKKYDKDMDSIREGLYGKYRSYSVDTTLANGERGIKMFRFTTDQYPTIGEQQREERDLTKKYGKEVRVIYMDPEMLRHLKYVWYIVINPTPQNNDELAQLLFIKNVRSAMELFGPQALNQEYVKQRFAVLINEDYNKFFKKMDVLQMLQLGLDDPAVKSATGRTGSPDKAAFNGMKAAAGVRKPLQAALQ